MFRTSAGTRDPHDQPCRAMISARSVAATVLLALTLVLTACGTTISNGGSTPGASPTARPPSTVKVYFAHHPETDEHPD
ncbi:MAG TPA: hypothetical protein VF116_05685 [Ktedonobacterales bacterium]